MACYLGIDGGGSKTTCAVGDETTQLAVATAGPSNITRVGEVRARESLHRVIGEACAAAHIVPQQLQRACIGVAGAGREEVAGALKKFAADLIECELEVVGDMEIALESAFGTGPGVVVIAGTGSMAYGRDEQGRTARAGGWGFAVSDEGSAYWIGRSAVSKLLRFMDWRDENQESAFLRKLKNYWRVDSRDGIVLAANSGANFAEILPVVISAAVSGDEIANHVLVEAGRELARLSELVIHQLFADDRGSNMIPLALAGGVFRHSRVTRETFCEELRRIEPRAEKNPKIVEPVEGALKRARRGAKSL